MSHVNSNKKKTGENVNFTQSLPHIEESNQEQISTLHNDKGINSPKRYHNP